jgi:hypothetical protein
LLFLSSIRVVLRLVVRPRTGVEVIG